MGCPSRRVTSEAVQLMAAMAEWSDVLEGTNPCQEAWGNCPSKGLTPIASKEVYCEV